jgi:hypothetical protein
MGSRANGERVRIRHAVSRLKAMLSVSLDTVLTEGHGAAEVGAAIATTACDIAMRLAKLEAYTYVEKKTETE